MASWRRQYLYTARYHTAGVYRLTGRWPLFSASESYIRLSDDEGGAVEYVSETGIDVLRTMADVNLSFPFSAEPGDRILTLDALLPDDASSEAAWVRFAIEVDRLRVWDGIHTYRPECYETAPPALWGPESFDVKDRWSAAFACKVINLLYANDDQVEDVLQEWAGEDATVTWIPDDGEPGRGLAGVKVGTSAFLFISGTSTTGQLITQTLQFNQGPKSYVNFSTLPIWYQGMSAAIDVLGVFGIGGITTLTVCGHSMGGAIACSLAGMLDRAHPNITVNVLTFGSPRAGDQRLSDIVRRKRSNHIAIDNDPIPSVPPHRAEIAVPFALPVQLLVTRWERFRPMGAYSILSADGSLTAESPPPMSNVNILAILAALVGGGPILGGDAHALTTYESYLRLGQPQ